MLLHKLLRLFLKISRTTVLFSGATDTPFWISGNAYPGFHSQVISLVCVFHCLHVVGFIRFASGTTPADLLVISTKAEPSQTAQFLRGKSTHFSDIGNNNIDGTHQRIASLLLSQFLIMNWPWKFVHRRRLRLLKIRRKLSIVKYVFCSCLPISLRSHLHWASATLMILLQFIVYKFFNTPSESVQNWVATPIDQIHVWCKHWWWISKSTIDV